MVSPDIVIGSMGVTLPVIIGTFGYQVFYRYITQNEENVKTKVKEDISTKIKEYEKLVKEKGLNEYIQVLTQTAKIEQLITEGKESFEKWMLWTTVGGIITLMLYLSKVTIGSFTPDSFKALTLVFFFMFVFRLKSLSDSKAKIEKYLSGIPAEKIIDVE